MGNILGRENINPHSMPGSPRTGSPSPRETEGPPPRQLNQLLTSELCYMYYNVTT